MCMTCKLMRAWCCAGMHAGMRAASNKADLALIVADQPAAAAGVFTQNVLCAAPVSYCKRVLSQSDTAQAVRRPAFPANGAVAASHQTNPAS